MGPRFRGDDTPLLNVQTESAALRRPGRGIARGGLALELGLPWRSARHLVGVAVAGLRLSAGLREGIATRGHELIGGGGTAHAREQIPAVTFPRVEFCRWRAKLRGIFDHQNVSRFAVGSGIVAKHHSVVAPLPCRL